MSTGLELSLKEFGRLPQKEQHNVLFENAQRSIEKMDKLMASFEDTTNRQRWKNKWLFAWLGTLTTASIGVGVWCVEKLYSLKGG